jgi:hypothetical protein
MHGLRNVNLFPSALIDNMRKSFEVVCAKLELAPQTDKATALVVTKIVELANAGRRGDDLTAETLRYFEAREPENRATAVAGSRSSCSLDARKI